MEISKIVAIDEETPVVVHLPDPAGKPEYYTNGDGQKVALKLRVVGSYSPTYRAAQGVFREALTELSRLGQTATDQEKDDLALNLEASCIKSWSFTKSGALLAITGDNWKALVTMRPNWRDALVLAVHDHERFFDSNSPR